MSDSDSNPPRHNARWSDQQKRKVMQLRRSGKKYEDIATIMGRTKLSVKSMCERLERAQLLESQTQQTQNENKKETSIIITADIADTAQFPLIDNTTNSQPSQPSPQQQIPWPANNKKPDMPVGKNQNEIENERNVNNVKISNESNVENNSNNNQHEHKNENGKHNEIIVEREDIHKMLQTLHHTKENNNNYKQRQNDDAMKQVVQCKKDKIIINEIESSKDSETEIEKQTLTETEKENENEKQNQRKKESECKDNHNKLNKIQETKGNKTNQSVESDTDCVIISASTKSNKMNKINKKSKGNQGSDAEYRRLIQKHGQSMRYLPDDIVTFFVPRLAAKGRFKDRIGKIQCETASTESKYEIIDVQNGKMEIVPWKWILKSPPNPNNNDKNANKNAVNSRKRSVQQRDESLNAETVKLNAKPLKKHKKDADNSNIDIIPMHSLKTREEKLKEFNRRMNKNKNENNYCKSYRVPLHSSYYDGYNDNNQNNNNPLQRGRSLHHGPEYAKYRLQNVSPPPPKRRSRPYGYDDYHVPFRQHYRHKNKHKPNHKHIRSLSVFPQRKIKPRYTKITKYNNNNTVPPLQRDDNENSHHNDSTRRHVIDIADDGEVAIAIDEDIDMDIRIKPEPINKAKRDFYDHNRDHIDRDNRKHERDNPYNGNRYYERERSRSRSPSHIRPSNRIINNNNRYIATPTQSPSPPPPPRYNPYYNRYDNKYRRSTQSHHSYHSHHSQSHHRYYRPASPPIPQPIVKHSRSRDRDRDRNYYRMRSPPPPAPPPYDYYALREHRGEHREHRHHRDYYCDEMRDRRERDVYYRNDRYDRNDRRDRDIMEHQHENANTNSNSLSHSLLMQTWLQVASRMRGGSKLGQREINYLCQHDVRPDLIKQLMDSPKPIQEKYDMVAHCVDPTNGQNLTRSQVYSIIGAVITMHF